MMRCDLCIHEKVCDAWRHHKDGAMCENFVNKNDAAPVKHGHWILTERTKLVMTGEVGIKEDFRTATKDNVDKATYILKRHITITRPKCSACGYWGYDDSDITLYCPNCGAKMDGGDENE